MNVLVTGGMGYIGSHTCLALLEAGFTPVIYDNLSNSSVKVLEQLKAISNYDFNFIEGDIADTAMLESVFRDYNIPAVFHFASLKAVGESTEQPLRYYDNNVSGTLNLLTAMDNCGVKQIVFSSSATVYGDPQYLPIDEQHPISATNPYGWTKVMIEQILNDWCLANKNNLAISLRYFNPAGAHQSGLLGESPNGIPNNLIPYIAQTAVGKRDCVNVFGNDYNTEDGTGVRDYIHILDLAAGHVAAFSTHKEDNGSFVYNLGTGKGYSVLEIINAFSSSAKVKINYQFAPRRTGDIASNYADSSLAEKKLGWQAQLNIKSMTDDTWRWQSKYPNGLE
ncbi:UDP-glucose 4-epimerase GalE [Pseudocolwellia sp. AS88]|uniref:UDP-glucose 4-epimerase GalE n=1 Tax=Pseudocolwellia sp. AS88 TaxID=3063958 RepID=UPI0026E93208|nr:UDP-glucose 4-epimerase GalE [Pseudocolwellia sp. AS88]MDO7084789.1 UDP-glucose 4-epimerase GalE [Pseudocolwellia sp. AS88]